MRNTGWGRILRLRVREGGVQRPGWAKWGYGRIRKVGQLGNFGRGQARVGSDRSWEPKETATSGRRKKGGVGIQIAPEEGKGGTVGAGQKLGRANPLFL